MATNKPNIADWEKVFLDSSIIINLLLYKRGSTDPVCNFVYKLISFLSGAKQKDGKSNRKFYVSVITLSEVLDRDINEMIPTIINLINSNNVEFITFDDDIAISISKQIPHHLINEKLNEFAKELGWKANNLALAREWINRDFMIAMSGKNREVDVHLTTDVRTFPSVCDKIGSFCAMCYPELFNQSEELIFEYYTGKAKAFIEKTKQPKAHKGKIAASKSQG